AVADWDCMVGLTFWVPAGIETAVMSDCSTRLKAGPMESATSTLSVTGTKPTSSTYTLRSLWSAGLSAIATDARRLKKIGLGPDAMPATAPVPLKVEKPTATPMLGITL